MKYLWITLVCGDCGKERTSEFHVSNLTKRERNSAEMITTCHTCAKTKCNMKG